MRKNKLHENAAKYLEPGESIRESGIVTNRMGTRNTALVATDEKLYAFRLKWPGQSNVAEQVMVVPLEEVRLEGKLSGRLVNMREIKLVNRHTGAVLQNWRRAASVDLSALGEHVDSHGGADASPTADG